MRLLRRWTEPAPDWEGWSDDEVVDVPVAAFALRTYLEQAEVRRYLDLVVRERGGERLLRACDLGAGFGRLTPVLAERAKEVLAFEREPEMVMQARALMPDVSWRQVRQLAQLPTAGASCDFVLSFTVLQHLTDPVADEVCREIRRVLRSPGFALLCEETDEDHRAGQALDPLRKCTVGRSVARYEQLMAPMRLVETSPRRIEPTYPRPDVGTYMLFGTG